jgi:hypothetical protein
VAGGDTVLNYREVEVGNRYVYRLSRVAMVLEVTATDDATVTYHIISHAAQRQVYRAYCVSREDFARHLEHCTEVPR